MDYDYKYAFLRFPDWKDKALTLSYDDGSKFDLPMLEIMKKHGIKGTFNINSGRFGEMEGDWHLTKEQAIKAYGQDGIEVAVHGSQHVMLEGYSTEQITYEILSDRKTLEDTFGKIVKGMAYAYGSVNDEIVSILEKCGISYSRTVHSTERFNVPNDWLHLPATCHHNNPRLMELAKEFLEAPQPEKWWYRKPKLFYLWGHSFEFDRDGNWDVFEKFAAYMGGRDNVWYATNGEIYEYVKAYERLQYSVDGTMVYNPSALDVYIENEKGKYVVLAGKTAKLTKKI
ncbi:MAG: polysaccharide deacetylase family protein [Clostridia bacterium]|nr:polysaccharide deacetylase family protein [Clostridia bacterium]